VASTRNLNQFALFEEAIAELRLVFDTTDLLMWLHDSYALSDSLNSSV
jgi:hypothetical protein